MGEIIGRILFVVFYLPIIFFVEGYKKLKKFLSKRGFELNWTHAVLFILIFVLIILLLSGFQW